MSHLHRTYIQVILYTVFFVFLSALLLLGSQRPVAAAFDDFQCQSGTPIPTSTLSVTSVANGWGAPSTSNAARLLNGSQWSGWSTGYPGTASADIDLGSTVKLKEVHLYIAQISEAGTIGVETYFAAEDRWIFQNEVVIGKQHDQAWVTLSFSPPIETNAIRLIRDQSSENIFEVRVCEGGGDGYFGFQCAAGKTPVPLNAMSITNVTGGWDAESTTYAEANRLIDDNQWQGLAVNNPDPVSVTISWQGTSEAADIHIYVAQISSRGGGSIQVAAGPLSNNIQIDTNDDSQWVSTSFLRAINQITITRDEMSENMFEVRVCVEHSSTASCQQALTTANISTLNPNVPMEMGGMIKDVPVVEDSALVLNLDRAIDDKCDYPTLRLKTPTCDATAESIYIAPDQKTVTVRFPLECLEVGGTNAGYNNAWLSWGTTTLPRSPNFGIHLWTGEGFYWIG